MNCPTVAVLLPGRAIEFPFLFCLLSELAVMVLAQVDSTRFSDQLEFGQGFLHFSRG